MSLMEEEDSERTDSEQKFLEDSTEYLAKLKVKKNIEDTIKRSKKGKIVKRVNSVSGDNLHYYVLNLVSRILVANKDFSA